MAENVSIGFSVCFFAFVVAVAIICAPTALPNICERNHMTTVGGLHAQCMDSHGKLYNMDKLRELEDKK